MAIRAGRNNFFSEFLYLLPQFWVSSFTFSRGERLALRRALYIVGNAKRGALYFTATSSAACAIR
jgi:hypothetical protein